MRKVSLGDLFANSYTRKYISRSGLHHAISTAFHAFRLAKQYNVDVDLAVKAAFLHDIGHYTWYRNGEWDFELYKKNDIHAIKGSERAHKLLIKLGEDRENAKEIALAILFHTDSFIPGGNLQLTPLQKVVALADEADEEPGGKHHYKKISAEKAAKLIAKLDKKIEAEYESTTLKQSV
ncbi:HD domain-containing protein [Pseudalkalibacillus caeni]|uniref:HD domain-containing protein n=1 Tax=Exobacillus caeni TaxID=2574798 RepID=A0A5R9F851_9BACL|nr:HD domain-containing protein [Pseudalkalibacillus caeni]TLS37808.1 HD domain-containing protein [Pseudalkalibacillus caeni]